MTISHESAFVAYAETLIDNGTIGQCEQTRDIDREARLAWADFSRDWSDDERREFEERGLRAAYNRLHGIGGIEFDYSTECDIFDDIEFGEVETMEVSRFQFDNSVKSERVEIYAQQVGNQLRANETILPDDATLAEDKQVSFDIAMEDYNNGVGPMPEKQRRGDWTFVQIDYMPHANELNIG